MSELWITKSSRTGRRLACGVTLVVGLLMAWLARSFGGPGVSGERSAFVLGVLLALVALWLLVSATDETIAVDPVGRRLVVEANGRFRARRLVVSFKDVKSTGVESISDRDNGSRMYFVEVRLVDGRRLRLFNGFYQGVLDHSVAQERRQRLQQYLGREV